jgi:hypothetical protein
MPRFGRSDGDLVRGEGPVRRLMPYLMRLNRFVSGGRRGQRRGVQVAQPRPEVSR